MSLNEFGLPPNATPDEVKEEWRRRASVLHPDHGGDAAEFTRQHKIYKAALDEALTPRVCTVCNGSKTELIQNGWNAIRVACRHCNGTGVEP